MIIFNKNNETIWFENLSCHELFGRFTHEFIISREKFYFNVNQSAEISRSQKLLDWINQLKDSTLLQNVQLWHSNKIWSAKSYFHFLQYEILLKNVVDQQPRDILGLCEEFVPGNPPEFFFDRNPENFGTILEMYRCIISLTIKFKFFMFCNICLHIVTFVISRTGEFHISSAGRSKYWDQISDFTKRWFQSFNSSLSFI